jgi:hypothetical protein
VRLHASEVDCTFATLAASDGSAVLALSTFGSDHRAMPGTVSQSIQFDEVIALELLSAMRKAFPGISIAP